MATKPHPILAHDDLDLRPASVRNRTATFGDVIDKLSYLRDLGFNGIQLLPIGDVFNDLGRGIGIA